MKIISVHDWKIFVKIAYKSVDFMSKPFKKQDEIQDSQLQIIINKGRPTYLLLKFCGVHSQDIDTRIPHVKHSKTVP